MFILEINGRGCYLSNFKMIREKELRYYHCLEHRRRNKVRLGEAQKNSSNKNEMTKKISGLLLEFFNFSKKPLRSVVDTIFFDTS